MINQVKILINNARIGKKCCININIYLLITLIIAGSIFGLFL